MPPSRKTRPSRDAPSKQDRHRERERARREGRDPAPWAMPRQHQAHQRRAVTVAGRLDASGPRAGPQEPRSAHVAPPGDPQPPGPSQAHRATLADLHEKAKQDLAAGLDAGTTPAGVAARALKDLAIVGPMTAQSVEAWAVEKWLQAFGVALLRIFVRELPGDRLAPAWAAVTAAWDDREPEPEPDSGPRPLHERVDQARAALDDVLRRHVHRSRIEAARAETDAALDDAGLSRYRIPGT